MKEIFDRAMRRLGVKRVMFSICKKKAMKCLPLSMGEKEAISALELHSPDPKSSSITPKKEFGNDYDLAIVVPAYNVEKYITQCIQSVLSQKTEYSFHVICVDDGSTDHTGQLLDNICDEKLSVIHQTNKGFSGARNRGLQEVAGNYIMFLDSDDFLPQGTIQALMTCALQNDADIVEGGVIQCHENGSGRNQSSHVAGRIESFSGLTGYPFAKVYRNSLFSEVSFPENYWYEDSLVRQILYPSANVIFGIDVPVYCRRDNPSGITNTGVRKKKSIDSLYVTLSLYRDRCRIGLPVNQEYYEYILRMAKLTYLRTRFQPEDVKKALFIVFSSFILREFSSYHSQENTVLETALRSRKYELFSLWCEM